MASTSFDLPLFQRYHAVAISKCKAELAALGLEAKSDARESADALRVERLDGTPISDKIAALEAAGAVLERTLVKNIDANYFVGTQLGESCEFSEAVADVHTAVRVHSQDSVDETAANAACLPPTRWTLCLGIFRIYTPPQLKEVVKVLQEDASNEALSLSFEGLRCLGPTKLTAVVANRDLAVLNQLAARLQERLARWSGGKPPAPHVTLVKFTYPFGDKKAKAHSTQAANRLALHKVNWSAQLTKTFAVSNVKPLAIGLHQMHPGGGAHMGDTPYAVVWSSTSAGAKALQRGRQSEPEPERDIQRPESERVGPV